MVNKSLSRPSLCLEDFLSAVAPQGTSVLWGEAESEELGTQGTYLVQFYLLLLREVPVTVLEVFQNHFLPRSVEKRGIAVSWLFPRTVSNHPSHRKAECGAIHYVCIIIEDCSRGPITSATFWSTHGVWRLVTGVEND